MPDIPGIGLVKGLGVTLKTMLKPAVTVQYPHVKEAPAPRARGPSSGGRRCWMPSPSW